MNKYLLFSVSAAALLLAGAMSHSALAADPVERATDDDSYISVFGGFNWGRASQAYNTSQYEINLKNGFTIGAVYGNHIGNGFRTESELSFVANDNDTVTDGFNTGKPTQLKGTTHSVYFFKNLWKDFELSGSIQPYIGAGIGVADIIAQEHSSKVWDSSGPALAGQIGAGVRVALSDRLALDLSYRFRGAMDASLHSFGTRGNGEFSQFSHTAELGVSYALGDSSKIMSHNSGDPSDWYASVFAGGEQTRTNFNYSDGTNNVLVDPALGFKLGGAVGTHLAPGLRTEVELSYLRSGLDRENYRDGRSDPAGGSLDQGTLLFNVWKDYNLGAFTPYVGGGFGVGALHFDNANFNGNSVSSSTAVGFAGQFGLGARMALSDNLSVDLGYRFNSIFDAHLLGDKTTGLRYHSDVATTNHVVQLGLTYGLGAHGASNAAAPDSNYVSLFGGAVLPVSTHASYDSTDYLVNFKTGYTVGAAFGTNVTDKLRSELELSMQSYGVDSADQSGKLTKGSGGHVNGYFAMANLWRDMDLGAFKPYAGAGVGVGLMDVAIDYANGRSVKGLDPGLAAQVGSGIRFNVSDNMMVDIGYRFRAVMAVGTEGAPGTGDRNNSSSYFSHNAQIGVSWKF